MQQLSREKACNYLHTHKYINSSSNELQANPKICATRRILGAERIPVNQACRRDMSKKEEQLLSPEDHERLAAAALESDVLRGRWAFPYPERGELRSGDALVCAK